MRRLCQAWTVSHGHVMTCPVPERLRGGFYLCRQCTGVSGSLLRPAEEMGGLLVSLYALYSTMHIYSRADGGDGS